MEEEIKMTDFDLDKFIMHQKDSTNLNLGDFPEIDLYMDQVIQLFENKLEYTKRNSDDKILTKTMINNYAKGDLLMKINNKKYTKEHMILIGLIYNLKGALSLSDIKMLFAPMLKDFADGKDYPLYSLYEAFLKIYDDNIKTFDSASHEISDQVSEIIKNAPENLGSMEEKFLLICSYVSMANLFRRLSEKLIDECFAKDKKGEKKK